jgi:aldose sugar dehydrogenase
MISLPTLAPSVILSVILFLHISSPAFGQPSISEPSLTAELVLGGLLSPTSIAYLNENNILLLEKEGRVRLISNGQLQPEPVPQLQGVESNNERGLLGIEVMVDKVFLYVTESGAQVEGIPSEGDVRNRVYSYTWDGTSLTNPQVL